MGYPPASARCDWSRPLAELALPDDLRQAIIAHRSELAPLFVHLSVEAPVPT